MTPKVWTLYHKIPSGIEMYPNHYTLGKLYLSLEEAESAKKKLKTEENITAYIQTY